MLNRLNKRHVVNLLAKKVDEYRKLAMALDVDSGFVRGLSNNNNEKLDEIVEKWMTTP